MKKHTLTNLGNSLFKLAIVCSAISAFASLPYTAAAKADKSAQIVGKSTREFPIPENAKFLSVPISFQAAEVPLKIVEIGADGNKILREEEVSLSLGKPDWTASIDLSPFAGKKLALTLALLHEAKFTPQFTDAPAIESSPDFRKEANRPLFHYTPPHGWLHDPNGLVYADGKWHAFHQFSACGFLKWKSPMEWKLAESKDLVNWEYKPVAIFAKYADDHMAQAFSGTAYFDKENRSGLFSSKKGGAILAYSRTTVGECIAYTEDFKTFKELPCNPIITADGRDPHIFFHEPTNNWVIFRYQKLGPDKGTGNPNRIMAIWTSPDLKKWTQQSTVEGSRYECPDVFEIADADNPSTKKWALFEASGAYSLGDFDGKKFTPTTEIRRELLQGSNYAGQTFDSAPDGRNIMVTLLRARDIPKVVKMPFTQGFCVPMEVSMRKDGKGVEKLFLAPVKELTEKFAAPSNALKSGKISTSSMSDIEVELKSADAKFCIEFGGTKLAYEAKESKLTRTENFGKKKSQKYGVSPAKDGKIKIKMFVDKIFFDVFWNGGENAVLGIGNFAGDECELKLSAENAEFKKFTSSKFESEKKRE